MCQALTVRATYEAWNGHTYPWPPPEDWHEADDGRWWAPDSLPDDPDVESPPVPTNGAIPETDDGAKKPLLGALPDSSAGLWQPDEESPWWKQPAVALSAGIVALLIVIGSAVALFGSGTDPDRTETNDAASTNADTEQSTSQASLAGQAAESTPADRSVAPAQADAPPAGDPSDTPTTIANGQTSRVEPTTTAETPATTASETTANTVDSPTAVAIDPDDQAQVEALRTYLANNGLSGDLISDADLVEFANTFCVFAINADTRQQYDASRDEAIANSSSRLTQEELALAVDGAVQVFCPTDAQRLGLDG